MLHGPESAVAACNGQGSVEARFARWMLLTHGRVAGNYFKLKPEFLAQMPGVHLPGASLIADPFQLAGMIQYNRGDKQILNRRGIEEVACECYFDVRCKFQRRKCIEYG